MSVSERRAVIVLRHPGQWEGLALFSDDVQTDTFRTEGFSQEDL